MMVTKTARAVGSGVGTDHEVPFISSKVSRRRVTWRSAISVPDRIIRQEHL